MITPESSRTSFALIYGLSANPVHQGHIDVLIGALDNLQKLDYSVVQILIIPVYRRNPVGNHKDVLPGTYEQRMTMCELAAQQILDTHPGIQIKVSRVEACLALKNKSPNYTADTLTFLKKGTLSNLDIIFLISSEIVSGVNPEFTQWHKTATILKIANLAVCPRPGFPLNQSYLNKLTENGGRIILLDSIKTLDISSTVLRSRMERGVPSLVLAQEGLIPLPIAQYIDEQNMYRNNKSSCSKSQFHHDSSA